MTKQEIIDYVVNTPSNSNQAVLNGMLDSITDAVMPSGTVWYTSNGEKDVAKYATAKIDVPTYDTTKSIIYTYGDYSPNLDDPGSVRDKIVSIECVNNISIGGNTFSGLSGLKSVSIPNADNIGKNAFAGCASLENVDISSYKGNSSHVGQFAGCSVLKTVISPQLEYISEGMFYGCASLTDIGLGKTEYIYKDAFKNCTSLKEAIMPKVRTIYESAFSGCTAIKHIYVGSSLTSAIYSDAFDGIGINGGVVIDCGFVEGQVSGAPWGAANATINYNVPAPRDI